LQKYLLVFSSGNDRGRQFNAKVIGITAFVFCSEESQATQIIVESCLSPQLDGFAFVHVDCIERDAVNGSNNAHVTYVIISTAAINVY